MYIYIYPILNTNRNIDELFNSVTEKSRIQIDNIVCTVGKCSKKLIMCIMLVLYAHFMLILKHSVILTDRQKVKEQILTVNQVALNDSNNLPSIVLLIFMKSSGN